MRALVFAVAAAACTGRHSATAPGHPSEPARSLALPTTTGVPATRARFVFFPTYTWRAEDALPLSKDVRLHVGEGGERWLESHDVGADGKDRITLVPAPTYALEDLVAVRRPAPDTLVFLGASGALYTAREPLGALSSKRAPAQALRVVSAGKASVVGITRTNEVVRSTDWGVTWATVTMPPHDRVLDRILLTRRGEGLILGSPGRLFATVDDGATFAKIASTGIGVSGFAVGADDEVLVGGLRASKGKSFDGWYSLPIVRFGQPGAVLESTGTPKLAPRAEVHLGSRRLPLTEEGFLRYASAIYNQEGALAGDRYYEARPDSENALDLAIYDLGAARTVVPITPKLSSCASRFVAAEGKVVVVGCVKDAPSGAMLTLTRSTDRGATFHPLAELLWDQAMPNRGGFWVTARGAVVLQGACLPPRTKDCGSAGPLVVSPSGQVSKSALPAGAFQRFEKLVSTAHLGDDRIHAVGRHDGGYLGLYSSNDGGKSFTLAPFADPNDPQHPGNLLDLAVDDTSQRVVVFTGDPTMRWASADHGLTFERLAVPIAARALSIAGTRGLASSETMSWETMDAGITWTAVELPKRRSDGSDGLVCAQAGCLLGERAARIGWDLAGPNDVKPVVAAPVVKPNVVHAPPPPIRCTTSGAPIRFVSSEPPIAAPAPGIAWVVLTKDALHAGVSVLIARRAPSKSTAPEEIVLFAPLSGETAEGTKSVTWESLRPEGAIAIRQRVGGGSGGSANMEVAWWNATSNKVRRATLPNAAMTDAALHDQAYDGVRLRLVAWLVPGYGALVRPTLAKGNDALWSITDAGKATQLTVPVGFPGMKLVAVRDGARTLMVGTDDDRHGGRQTFLGAMRDASAAGSAATLPTTAATLAGRWWGMWPTSDAHDPIAPRVFVTSTGSAAYLFSAFGGDDALPARTWAMPLAGDALDPPDALPAPTAMELAAAKPCDAASASRARIELPWNVGPRREVVITRATLTGFAPRVLETQDTIGRWDPKGACLSAQVTSRPTFRLPVAIVSFDDLARSTYFDRSVNGKQAIEAWTMTCAVAPASE